MCGLGITNRIGTVQTGVVQALQMFAIYNIIKMYHENLHAEEFYCCACYTSPYELVQYYLFCHNVIPNFFFYQV